MSAVYPLLPEVNGVNGIGSVAEPFEEGHFKELFADSIVGDYAGQAGGRILYGGIAANEDLTLEGTSHGTKTTSYVIMQPTGGAVLIGETSSGSNDPALVVGRTLTGSGNGHAFVDESTIDKTGLIGYNSFDADVTINGAQIYDHIAGFQSRPDYRSTGAIDRLTGFQSLPNIAATAGIVDKVTHFEARNYTGGGPASTQYGLLIKGLVGADQNHGIHFQSELNAGSLSSLPAVDITFKPGSGVVEFHRPGDVVFPTARFNALRTVNADQTNGTHTGMGFTTLDGAGTVRAIADIGAVCNSHAAGAVTGDFVILTSNLGSTTEKVRVKSSGEVGIGTTSPSHRLHVIAAGDPSIVAVQLEREGDTVFPARYNTLRSLNPSQVDGTYTGIGLHTLDGAGAIRAIVDIGAVCTSHAAAAVSGDFVIVTSDAGTVAEKLRVTSDGNVGIGVTVPTAKLDVDGGLKVRAGTIINNATRWDAGAGSPEGVQAAPVGSLYSRTDGGAGTCLYVKESGAGTDTGWIPK